MKSSKRKRCTTNEGTTLLGLLPLGVASTTASMSTSSLLISKNNDSQYLAKMMLAQKEDTSQTAAASTLLMFPNQAAALIKDNNPYYRSDASSPLLFQQTHSKMEPPNTCLQPSNLISSAKQQQLLYMESSKQLLNEHLPHNFYSTSQTNIVAAKACSYYNLTPASSTTSLNDLTVYNNNNNETISTKNLTKKKPSAAPTLMRTSSKKRTRTTTTEQQPINTNSEDTQETLAPTNTVRRRGRPPKNLNKPSQLVEQAQAAPIAVQEDTSIQTPVEPVIKSTSSLQRHNTIDSTHSYNSTKNSKLIKSLINKCSSNSNLQKSKVASETSVLTDGVNKPAKSNNVNTINKQQPQISGYLVDSKQNLSDIENNQNSHLKTPPQVVKLASNGYQTKELYRELDTQIPMPKLSWANNNELWQVMRRKELKYLHDPSYLKRHLNIEPQMRAILLDWLVEISYAYRLHRETWYLAVEYMDRFMTCSKQQMRVDRLQLIGMSALFLAAKVEEIYPPKLKELASHMESYSANNEDAIAQFELFMLKTLGWEISPVTANTWLMTYLQIASINYYSIINQDHHNERVHNTNMVMPLNIYKNSNLTKFGQESANQQSGVSGVQQQFYLENYMKAVTLLDLCMFEMDSMRFSYSVLAASAMYHMLTPMINSSGAQTAAAAASSATKTPRANNQLAALIVQSCTGYKLFELDACIKWMYPFADVCKEILTEEKMIHVKQFANIDAEDCHNIQLYYQNLELLKEAQSRRTPSKYYSNSSLQLLLTPPDSHRKFSSSSSSLASSYISDLSNTTVCATPASSNVK